MRHISTNISTLGQHTHLKLGELSSLFIVNSITIFFYFTRCIVFYFIFNRVTVHTLYSLPSLWKIGKKFSQFSPFDHATWQHPRENPRHVRGSAWIYDVSDCAICSKNREIFPYYGCARILRLTVSVPDYGSWFEVFTLIFLPQLLLLSQSDWLICRCRQGSRQRCPRQCVTPTLSHALPFSSRAQNLLWSNPAEPRQSTTF